MSRSPLYVTLLKRLIAARDQRDPVLFEKTVEEIRKHMEDLSETERFDLEINIKHERHALEIEVEEE